MASIPTKRSYVAAFATKVDAAVSALGTPDSTLPIVKILPEQIERRRFTRPIPIAQVIESTEADGWDLWHKWSEASDAPESR